MPQTGIIIGASFFLLFYVLPINAQSPPPQQNIINPIPNQDRVSSSSPSQISQQQPRTNDYQKASDSPVVNANKIKPPINNAGSDKSYNYEKENLKIQAQLSESTKKIAKLTRYLVAVGFLQVFVFLTQVLLLCKTLKATTIAANAAKKSANAAKVSTDNLFIVERAYIFSRVELEKPISDAVWPQRIGIVLYLKNYGRTPAIVKEIACHVGMYPIHQVNGNDLTESEKHYPINAFIAGGKGYKEDTKPLTITEDDYGDMMEAKLTRTIFCFGCVRYTNIFGQDHFHGFCWEFDGPSGRFALSPNEELNYNT